MLKKRDVFDCYELFPLMVHPEVFPFVRHKSESTEEMMFQTKQLIQEEEEGRCITRRILNEMGQSIGVIGLYDIQNQAGFLATWIGKVYHGKGYNALAKEQFLTELFYEKGIERIFVKVRKRNLRSLRAMDKLSYATFADELFPSIVEEINSTVSEQNQFHLFVVEKESYYFYQYSMITQEETSMEA